MNRRYSRALASTWRQRDSFCYRSLTTARLARFILLAGLFIISLPFLAKFQTNKVVTQPPDVITSYEQVMARGSKIIFNREVSDENLLKPSSESIAHDDISARLYRYMIDHPHPFRFATSGEGASDFDPTVDAVMAGKIVMFAANYISDGFKSAFCSWSNESHLIQSLVSTDPSSREMFTGYPMKKGFHDASLLKKLRRIFEAHLTRAIIDVTPEYVGLELKKGVTTAEHRREQLVLCMSDDLVREQKEPQPTELRSFSLVIAIFFSFNTAILLIHLRFKI